MAASGNPPVAYQWFSLRAIAGDNRHRLFDNHVQVADGGLYDISFPMRSNFASSINATLDVVPNPSNASPNFSAIRPPLLSSQNASSRAFAYALGAYYGLFSGYYGVSSASSGGFSAKVTRHAPTPPNSPWAGASFKSGSFSPN